MKLLPILLLSIITAGHAAPPAINPQPPAIPERRFVITDYGAVGDSETLNTEAFRKAIAACREAGGGRVVVPSGVFVTGPFELASNTALVLDKAAVIRGSAQFSDWGQASGGSDEAKLPVSPLITGKELSNVAILGEGTVDGNGAVWWQRFRAEVAAGAPKQGQAKPGQKPATPRPHLIRLTNCRSVHVAGVTLKDAPNFHLVPQKCEDVLIEDVKIFAPDDSPNTDGIDPTSCRNVLIRRCLIDVGDDNISFKSNRKSWPLENVLVTDCTFKHGHGASIGSNFGSGVRNLTVQNCTFEGTDNAIRLKSSRDRGGPVENVTYRDITMKNVGTATTFNLFYADKPGVKARETKPVTESTPIVRGIRVINVTCESAKNAGDIIGLPEMPIDDVLFENVRINSQKGMFVQDAKGVEFRNVEIRPAKGEPLFINSAEVKKTSATANGRE